MKNRVIASIVSASCALFAGTAAAIEGVTAATYSLDMNQETNTASTQLGGEALPNSETWVATFDGFVAVRGSESNKACTLSAGHCPWNNTDLSAVGSSVLLVTKLSATENGILFNVGSTKANSYALIQRSSTKIALVKNNDNADNILEANVTNGGLQFHTIVLTSESTEDSKVKYSLYVDGTLASSTTKDAGLFSSGYQFGTTPQGTNPDGVATGAGIQIDEFGAWTDHVLTTDEVTALAAAYPVWPEGVMEVSTEVSYDDVKDASAISVTSTGVINLGSTFTDMTALGTFLSKVSGTGMIVISGDLRSKLCTSQLAATGCTIKFNGFSCWIEAGSTVPFNMVLEDTDTAKALTIVGANANASYTFSGKISGSGSIEYTQTDDRSCTFKLTGDLADWTGSFINDNASAAVQVPSTVAATRVVVPEGRIRVSKEDGSNTTYKSRTAGEIYYVGGYLGENDGVLGATFVTSDDFATTWNEGDTINIGEKCTVTTAWFGPFTEGKSITISTNNFTIGYTTATSANLKGVNLTIAADTNVKLGTNYGSTTAVITDSTIAGAGTLTVADGQTLKVTGTSKFTSAVVTGAGTVELDLAYGATKTGIDLNNYVDTGALKVKGISGDDVYFSNTSVPAFELVDGGAIAINNANSNQTITFAEVSGTGTLTQAMSGHDGGASPSGVQFVITKLIGKNVALSANQSMTVTELALETAPSLGEKLISTTTADNITLAKVTVSGDEQTINLEKKDDGIYVKAGVAQIGTVQYATLAEAIAAAQATAGGATIKVLTDLTLDSSVAIDGTQGTDTVTIDLNGSRLYIGTDVVAFVVTNGAKVAFVDSTAKKEGAIVNQAGSGTAVQITGTSSSVIVSDIVMYCNQPVVCGGSLTVNSGALYGSIPVELTEDEATLTLASGYTGLTATDIKTPEGSTAELTENADGTKTFSVKYSSAETVTISGFVKSGTTVTITISNAVVGSKYAIVAVADLATAFAAPTDDTAWTTATTAGELTLTVTEQTGAKAFYKVFAK